MSEHAVAVRRRVVLLGGSAVAVHGEGAARLSVFVRRCPTCACTRLCRHPRRGSRGQGRFCIKFLRALQTSPRPRLPLPPFAGRPDPFVPRPAVHGSPGKPASNCSPFSCLTQRAVRSCSCTPRHREKSSDRACVTRTAQRKSGQQRPQSSSLPASSAQLITTGVKAARGLPPMRTRA